ncbi:MAG: endolytic transglycosylase MltG [Archangium sp.]|nr:endolytic transglycosylase MltG [Archangium sp.]
MPVRRLAMVLAVGAVLAGAAALLGWRWVESAGVGPLIHDDVVFEVPKGTVGSKVPKLLNAAGLLSDLPRAQLYVKLHPPAPKFGKHQLTQGMSLAQVLEQLGRAPIPDDVSVTILEGWRLADTDEALAALTPPLMVKGAYLAAASDPSRYTIPFPFSAPTLEGYVLPNTFAVPSVGFDPQRLIQRQLDAFHAAFSKPYAEEISKSGRSLHDLVIVASMLEREEPTPANRPTIAGVIYRRLAKKVPLGIDATSRYSLAEWNDRVAFLARLRDPNDVYNTRLRTGLPAGPIGAPTLDSLLAALRPVESEWLYYLHDKNRVLHFARTAAEHEANRRTYDIY